MSETTETIVQPILEQSAPCGVCCCITFFLLFLVYLAVAYVLPFLGTISAQKNSRKWLAYWFTPMLAQFIATPLLGFIIGKNTALLVLIFGSIVMMNRFNNQTANCLITQTDCVLAKITPLWNNVKTRVVGLAKKYGLIQKKEPADEEQERLIA